MDKLIHGLAANATVRVMAAITTDTVREAVRRHQTSPTVTAALGRTLTGTLLLSSSLKDFDRLTVKIESEGLVEGIIAEAIGDGKVRGYVKNPVAELPLRADGNFDVPGIIGKGMFYVIREAGFNVGFRPEPYVGSVPIKSGEIGEDFANYLLKSEQIPSAVLLAIQLQAEEPYVTCAGGVMIQMLPSSDENIAVMIEDTILHMPKLTDSIREGATPEDLLKMALGLIDYEILGEKDVKFECNCSYERAVQLIASLGKTEVRSMLEQDKGASMTCGFCNETYTLTEEDLQKILEAD
ncbi:MAG TPA: Hsp33 family molecular chaperone HslO [Pyrinomonadaceae bacterium]|nr:Hsp33 family molecular chaperone HslO [Pyrinomonadaceae bacterium]